MASLVIDETRNVMKKLKSATISSLGDAGRYIRGIVRKSISKKNTVSIPGKPPHSPTGRLHSAIIYEVDKDAGSVVIGPAGAVFGKLGRTLEFGGTEPPKRGRRGSSDLDLRVGHLGPVARRTLGPVTPEREFSNGNADDLVWVRLRTKKQVERAKELLKSKGIQLDGRSKTRHYPKRPFMGPALERSKARIPTFWRNILKDS